MNTSFFVICVGVVVQRLICFSAEVAPASSLRVYPYIFKESTDDHMFVIADKALRPIKGFTSLSNMTSVNALNSLRANVLYENGDGTKMFLLGSYDNENATFTLSAWFIIAPFLSREVVNEKELPHRTKLNLRNNLRIGDFSTKVATPSSFVLQSGTLVLPLKANQEVQTSKRKGVSSKSPPREIEAANSGRMPATTEK